jgi:hypothetical protein
MTQMSSLYDLSSFDVNKYLTIDYENGLTLPELPLTSELEGELPDGLQFLADPTLLSIPSPPVTPAAPVAYQQIPLSTGSHNPSAVSVLSASSLAPSRPSLTLAPSSISPPTTTPLLPVPDPSPQVLTSMTEDDDLELDGEDDGAPPLPKGGKEGKGATKEKARKRKQKVAQTKPESKKDLTAQSGCEEDRWYDD